MRSRRVLAGVLLAAIALGSVPTTAADGEPRPRLGFAAVRELAAELARRPYREPAPPPDVLARLNYDEYRLIAFLHDHAVWRKASLPFWVEFHHRGSLFTDRVDIVLVEDGRERPVPFDPDLFEYRGKLASLEPSRDWGYAGFRLLTRLPARPHVQEFCSFLGASYFRAICTNQVYGVSARGVAIDTARPEPEEFPAFRTVWIEQPAADAQSVRVWALLDGPSVTGAYEFRITPGLERTTLDVECRLHFRRAVEKLGVAPMSSMWAWGAAGPGNRPANDPRPQVHDSDGLLVADAGGEWLWRPLTQREQDTVSRFEFAGLRGFGLLQRDRAWDHYRDNEAQYHLRPSVWVTPREPWGAGAVELFEFPREVETQDNVTAYWVPREPVRAGDERTLAYQVAFAMSDPADHRSGRFVRTRVDRDGRNVQFTLTIEGEALRSLTADADLQPVVTTSRGRVADAAIVKLPNGTWELRFRLTRDGDGPSELRAFVRRGDAVLTETWSHLEQ